MRPVSKTVFNGLPELDSHELFIGQGETEKPLKTVQKDFASKGTGLKPGENEKHECRLQ